MRDQYWTMYMKIKYHYFYYKHYSSFFNKVNFILSSFCTLVSLSCVTAWGIWGSHPVTWSLIIGISQVIQALSPKFSFNNFLISCRFIMCPLNNLLCNIDLTWMRMNYIKDYSDKKIFHFIQKYSIQNEKLTNQFFADSFLPEYPFLKKRADRDLKNFISLKYPTKKEV